MAQTKETFSVVEGPSKFDLMTSLFVGHTEQQPRVKFGLRPAGETAKKSMFPINKHVVDVRVMSLGREDGSGENWIISGYLRFEGEMETAFSGFYTTQERNGYFTVTFA